MLSAELLETKVKELIAQIEQSAANHHILLGSKLTYDTLLEELKKPAVAVSDVSELETTD